MAYQEILFRTWAKLHTSGRGGTPLRPDVKDVKEKDMKLSHFPLVSKVEHGYGQCRPWMKEKAGVQQVAFLSGMSLLH